MHTMCCIFLNLMQIKVYSNDRLYIVYGILQCLYFILILNASGFYSHITIVLQFRHTLAILMSTWLSLGKVKVAGRNGWPHYPFICRGHRKRSTTC